MVLERGQSNYLVNTARLVRTDEDMADLAAETTAASEKWDLGKSNPYVRWIGGDFVEADVPNQNRQFWTAGDLALSEYSIRHAPLNMVHKFRQPVGFFAATRQVKTPIAQDAAAQDEAAKKKAGMKIQALSGMWTHLFPVEAVQVEAADDAGLLFYSMECRGTHVKCGSDEARKLEGCGKTFEYAKVDTHCEHILARSSVRHIVNPTFRGGALIVPPVRPGWKQAHASVLTDAVMQEAASFAEENQKQYAVLNEAGDLSAAAWEETMGLIVASTL